MDIIKFIQDNFLLIAIIGLFLYYVSIKDEPRQKNKKESFKDVKECSRQTISQHINDYVYDSVGRYVRPAASV